MDESTLRDRLRTEWRSLRSLVWRSSDYSLCCHQCSCGRIFPGKSKDKKRFVELLVRAAPETAGLISLPLLFNSKLPDEVNLANLEAHLSKFQPSQIITTSDVDLPENQTLNLCPGLPIKQVRSNSYACLLYEEVRSSYMHEYDAGNRTNPWAMSIKDNQPASYVNIVNANRRIHFHIEWLALIAKRCASYANELQFLPQSDPAEWWLGD